MIAVLLERLLIWNVVVKMPFNSWDDRESLKSEFLRVAATTRLIVGCVSRDGMTSA